MGYTVLVQALGIVVLDPSIRKFLEDRDPKCLGQCLSALEKVRTKIGLADSILNLFETKGGKS